MNDEVKEILDRFDKKLKNYELDKKFGQLSIDSICHLFPSEIITIKDCITNLQEENERLNTELDTYKDEFCKDTIKEYELVMEQEYYKTRCEKAIEFIKEEAGYDEEIRSCCCDLLYSDCDKLIELLGGDE